MQLRQQTNFYFQIFTLIFAVHSILNTVNYQLHLVVHTLYGSHRLLVLFVFTFRHNQNFKNSGIRTHSQIAFDADTKQ